MSDSPARVSAVNVGEHPNKGWVVSTFGKRTYLVHNGACVESPEQQPLQEVPVAAEDGVDLLAEADLVMHRDLVDIVVRGHAYPHARATSFEAGLAIDQFLAKFAVFGNRRVEPSGAGLRFTPPEQFDRIPLGWQSAYGGFDAVTHQKQGAGLDDLMKKAGIVPDPRFGLFSYPRNPLGKGYLCEINPETVAACALPNLEALDALLAPGKLAFGPKRWPAAPPPVSTTWLPYTFFPRSFWLGLPFLPFDDKQIRPDDFPEVRSGHISKDSARADGGPPERRFSPLVSQAAPLGLRCRAVGSSAKIRVKNLHPKFAQWDFKLPGDTPRMYVRWPGQQPTEVRPQIRTLLIEPDQDRVTLVWVADLVLPAPFPLAHTGAIEHAVRWRSG